MSYTDFEVETDTGETIDVRRVAADWHGGQFTDLYKFASSGHIGHFLDSEIERCLKTFEANAPSFADDAEHRVMMRAELEALLAYVTQPIHAVWSSYGHTFADSSDGYASCDRCGGEWALVHDDGADPSHGAYQASNGDEPTRCTGDTSMHHGHPRETGHSLDCVHGCEHCEHECNCVACHA